MLHPGQTIGILGGGQLARMMALAAAPLGLKCHIYAPAGDNPAFDVSAGATQAAYDDEEALAAFAALCRSAGTSGRRFAASASLRRGVGRPLPSSMTPTGWSSLGSGVVTGGFWRPNTPPG